MDADEQDSGSRLPADAESRRAGAWGRAATPGARGRRARFARPVFGRPVVERSAAGDPRAHDEALEALAFIRAAVDHTTRYSTFSALALALVGLAGLAGSGMCGCWTAWPGARTSDPRFVTVWAAVFAVAAACTAVLTALKARSRGEPVWTPIARQALAAMLGAGAALAAGTFALWHAGLTDLLPGLWLLLYGCALYGVSFFAPAFIRCLGLAFVLLGFAAWMTGPALSGAWLGIGFGGLHLLFGGIVLARYRR